MRRGATWGLLAIAVALLAAWIRVRTQRERSWAIVEQMCTCNRSTLARMSELRSVAMGGLDRVLTAQAHALLGECDALRIAAQRRNIVALVRGAPLRVEPTANQRRAARELTHALGLMCGDEHRAFWESLRVRVAEGAPTGNTPPAVLQTAREHLRVRDAMCANSRRLSAPPTSYTLPLSEAERRAARCGR